MRHVLPFLIFCRRLGTAWVLLLALTALAGGGSRHALLSFRISFGIIAFLIVAASLAFRRCRPTAWLRTIELLACNLALFLAIGEGSLRLLNAYSPRSLLLPRALDSFRLEPGRDYGAGLRGNHLGYPGGDFPIQKPTGMFRVAALGDSFAIGPAVSFEDNYLTRLQNTLPEVELLNFGVAGTGPREYLEILQTHARAFAPDLVLVSFFVGNDVTESLAVPRGLDPRQFLLYLAATRGLKVMRQPPQSEQKRDRLSSSGFSPEQFLEIEARRLEVCRVPPNEGLEKKWARALERLAAIAELGAACNARCAVVLIPDEFQVNAEICDAARRKAGIGETEIDLGLPQKRVCEFLAARGVPCLDLLPLFQRHPGAYAPRDTHWNAMGNRLAADAIARWLRDESLVPASSLASSQRLPVP